MLQCVRWLAWLYFFVCGLIRVGFSLGWGCFKKERRREGGRKGWDLYIKKLGEGEGKKREWQVREDLGCSYMKRGRV